MLPSVLNFGEDRTFSYKILLFFSMFSVNRRSSNQDLLVWYLSYHCPTLFVD